MSSLVPHRGRIVLLHFVGQMPLAGIAWQAVHYLVALEKLGYEAWYVEDHGANPYDPRIGSVVTDCAYNVEYLRRVMERHGLGGRWAYWDAINDEYRGLTREAVRALYARADALINLCGATRLRDEHMACPTRIMVDTDPVYEQIKYALADPAARAYLDAHTHFFTYGENLGTPDCTIPLCGVPWHPTRPPVDLDLWPTPEGEPPAFSTIATWENKGKNIDFEGQSYLWSKHVNFLKFLDLPRHRPGAAFRMAMAPPTDAVRREVEGQGWGLVDPMPVSAGMDPYRDFIAGSRGEFTVAKDIYVRPNSGWFSDRAVCYLAAGRPVVTMRTGFARHVPAGTGLFDYASHGEAVAAIDAVAADYKRHSRAAREIARDHFGGEKVVGELLGQCGL
ncbi:MAG TPA: hypothetical protein VHW66_02330 [Stellaceae bacterium]|jgi:hypothetical protein|nr:hypothetical protein [Stellaceae bacterium]